MYRYTVKCTFNTADSTVVDRWVAWLSNKHIAEVIQCGATGAELVKMSGPVPVFEVRYRFANLQAFEVYQAEHAPRLREDGLKEFPLSLGLAYERSMGEVVWAR